MIVYMDVTYQRDVGHCSKSNYVKEYTVGEILPAENSDSLDMVKFVEIDYQTIVKRGTVNIGDKLFFIPPESVLPFELSEELGITKYLSNGRVRITTLRGNKSEGIVADINRVTPYVDYIMQWEDPPSIAMCGTMMPNAETPLRFEEFYKMPNLRFEPHIFEIGESIVYSEKIHGTNCRFGNFENPKTGEPQLYVGSHATVLKKDLDNLYWRVVDSLNVEDRLPMNVIFYGEIYGMGIQDIDYGRKDQGLRVFAAFHRSQYVSYKVLTQMAITYDLEPVKFHREMFNGIEQLKENAEEKSEYYDGKREGIVVTSVDNPNKMAKLLSETYMKRKNKLERH
jgi:RNA ligase (TIGR02306 family)